MIGEFVELEHVKHTESIILGYRIASFSVRDSKGEMRTGHLVASGKIIRVQVDKLDGHVDIDIQRAVNEAFRMLTEESA